MAPKIKHKRSALPNNPPTAAQIEAGELAINTNSTSANLHFEDDGGTVRSVGADPSAAGTYERNVATADGVGTWVVAGSQAPGNDVPYGHWDRDNASTTLSPRIAGDDIATTGDVQGGNFIFDQTTADVTLAAEDPAAARTYTFPDVGSDRGVVLDPDTPATTTQYAREITSAGVATWEEIDIPPGTTIGPTPPLNPTEGQLWFNSDDGRLYIYYTDADSSQWVDASPDNDGEVLWTRTGTTLSPANAGDDVDIGSGNISLNADGSADFAGNVHIDSSGRLFVGTSSSSATATAVLQGASGDPCNLYLQRPTATPTDGTSLGQIFFADSGAGAGARIQAARDGGTWTSGASHPGRLLFATTADGASTPTERMRIDSQGAITTTQNGSFQMYRNIGSAATLVLGIYSDVGGPRTLNLRIDANGNVENTNNSYGSISDAKLKENIVDASSQWDDLKAIQVRNYNFKEGQTHTQIGLVAQEVELVSPRLVSESPDLDEEGNDLGTVTKSVSYSVLYMKAVKALQEAMERIEALEAEVQALKGGTN